MRILLNGRMTECLKNDPELLEIDKYMRWMNFLPDAEGEIAKLTPDTKSHLEAYAAGFNRYLSDHGPVYEWRLFGYKPEPWEIKDSLLIVRIIGFLGLADAQSNMEKFLVQMVQNDVEASKIRELFPYLTDPIDTELLKKVKLSPPLLPEAVRWLGENYQKFVASNNWAVSGSLTESGKTHPLRGSAPGGESPALYLAGNRHENSREHVPWRHAAGCAGNSGWQDFLPGLERDILLFRYAGLPDRRVQRRDVPA